MPKPLYLATAGGFAIGLIASRYLEQVYGMAKTQLKSYERILTCICGKSVSYVLRVARSVDDCFGCAR
jgi:hypothetical protein